MGIEDIITKECRRIELNPAEKKLLNNWLSEDSKNKKIYTQLKLSLLYPDHVEMDAVESKVWSDLKAKLTKEDQPKRASSVFSWIYKVAALLVLGLMAIFLINNIATVDTGNTRLVEVKMIEKVSLSGQKVTTVLPDGTKVKLNSESKLIVPEEFDPDKRVVQLTGEAFFEVVENRNAPFIVRSGNMEVKVLGTSFNVSAYEDDQVLKVGVKTGKVEVVGISESGGYSVTLLPNDISSWDPKEKHLKKDEIKTVDAVFGWTEQKLVFENHSLPEVLNTLSKWYGVTFHDPNQRILTAKRKYTAKYKNPTIEQMMISVAHVYDFDFEINKTENKITLK